MSDRFAALLGNRLSSLSSAAERTGASPESVERLLGAASAAAMRGLALAMLTERGDAREETPARAAGTLRDAA
jgi:hypothetical protein